MMAENVWKEWKENMNRLAAAFPVLLLTLFLFGGAARAQEQEEKGGANASPQDREVYYHGTEVDKVAEIIFQPNPTTGGRCAEAEGRVSLKVYLHRSGKVSRVEVLQPSSCEHFNEEAKKAGGLIEFKPAVKNKKPVSQYFLVDFMWKAS